MSNSLTPTVALRRRPGVTPADMVRISRCRPNVRPLARRVDNKHASPYTGEPNNPASRLQGRSTPLDLYSIAAANTEAPKACQHQHGGDPCSGLPPPPLTSRRPFLSYTGRGAFFLFGKTKRKNGGRIRAVPSAQGGRAAFFKTHFSFLSRKEKRFLDSKEKDDKGMFPLDPSVEWVT